MGLGDQLPFELARWIVPRLPKSIQRFTPTTSWDDATEASVGYESVQVNGTQEFTRTEPLSGNDLGVVAAFGSALAQLGNVDRPIRVVDFGGLEGRHAHLVSTAFPRMQFEWTVVELTNVVEVMKEFEHPGLVFSSNLDQVLKDSPDIAFASGAVNCVPDPFGVLNKLITSSPVTVLARLPLWPIPDHRVAVQRPQRKPVEISYPTWFFSEKAFLSELKSSMEIVLDFVCPNDRAFFARHYGFYRGLVLAHQ